MKKLHLGGVVVTALLTLTACGGQTASYSATGTWDGSSTNTNNSNYVANQRMVLNDQNGVITGDWYLKTDTSGYIKVGTISGTRSSTNNGVLSMTFTYTGLSGTAFYSGTFNGNSYTGSYTATEGGAGPFSFTRQ